MSEYEELRKLQELDIEIDDLANQLENLPEQAKLESLKEELQTAEKMLEEKQSHFTTSKTKQKKYEDELDILDSKIQKEDGKLFSGTIANPKELKSIQEEVVALRAKKDKMETDLLEFLDEVESMNSETNELKTKVSSLKNEVSSAEQETRKVTEDIEKKLRRLRMEREKIEPGISPSLMSVYANIRKRKKEAVVAIAEGVCQGCFVELPAEEVDKMLQSNQLWRCPQCRRILLR